MHGGIDLVESLAVILIAAAGVTIIFRWLKQPLLLGYIVAGFLVGEHLGLFSQYVNGEIVEEWAEIGIIFLLFSLGLEFSFKKLLKVGSSAIITAFTIFVGMFIIGVSVANILGWSSIEALFLGGMVSMSSTTIIIKVFEDLGLKKEPFANIIFGALVVEDLIAIMLMVLLSTFAVSQKFSGVDMVYNMGKLGFFLIFWFIIGIFILPSLLRKFRSYLNQETLLVLSVGLCFGMVVLANYAGFSSALGAFIMGSIIGETVEEERVMRYTKGLKDLFGAVFFVSVGMMVNPLIIVQQWKLILLLTVLVVVGIFLLTTIGVLLSGKPLKMAIRSGMSMAQMGEFAFIIASLGVSLGVMREFVYPVVVAVSVITTFTTPYLIRASEPISSWVEAKMPRRFLSFLEKSQSEHEKSEDSSDWTKLLKHYSLRVALYSVMLIAIYVASTKYLLPIVNNKLITLGITLAVMSPFLYGLAVKRAKSGSFYKNLWEARKINRTVLITLILFRVFLAIAFVASLPIYLYGFSWWSIFVVVFAVAAFYALARYDIVNFEKMEVLFLKNYNHKLEQERREAPITTSIQSQLSHHNIHLETLIVSQNSQYIGQKLREIPFRKDYGVNIIKIVRGSKEIVAPSADDYIYPSDKLLVIGRDNQLELFIKIMTSEGEESTTEKKDVGVYSYILTEKSYLSGMKVNMTNLRDSDCMLIGVERNNESIMNPNPDFLLQVGDKIWLVGEEETCLWFV